MYLKILLKHLKEKNVYLCGHKTGMTTCFQVAICGGQPNPVCCAWFVGVV
jgi:hypothetical protein